MSYHAALLNQTHQRKVLTLQHTLSELISGGHDGGHASRGRGPTPRGSAEASDGGVASVGDVKPGTGGCFEPSQRLWLVALVILVRPDHFGPERSGWQDATKADGPLASRQ